MRERQAAGIHAANGRQGATGTPDIPEQGAAIADALVRAREAAGMTQKEVAEAMGITQPAVARLESGKNISIRSIARYAAAVGRPVKVWIYPAD